jgi:hypothetical protein
MIPLGCFRQPGQIAQVVLSEWKPGMGLDDMEGAAEALAGLGDDGLVTRVAQEGEGAGTQ